MAMLAERRKKNKYSVDPRNLNWSKDDNKFGQRLMERMGWKKGKGLGANEDGNTEHIKVNVKDDNLGVGCTKDYADNWVAHQDDFNALLSSLNSTVTEETTKPSERSLEELSKSLKGRIHYKKFARGKDLTNAKNDDLNCIFGRRKSKSAPSTPQCHSEVNSDEEELDTEVTSHGITTIKSSTSVQDYFKQKMAAIKARSQGESVSAPASANQSSDEEMKEVTNQYVENDVSEQGKRKKKKSKKKSKRSDREGKSSSDDDENMTLKKRKLLKMKNTGPETNGDDENIYECDSVDVNQICDDGNSRENVSSVVPNTHETRRTSKEPKKKKKKKEKRSRDNSNEVDTDSVGTSQGILAKKRKHVEEEAEKSRTMQEPTNECFEGEPGERRQVHEVSQTDNVDKGSGSDDQVPAKKRKEAGGDHSDGSSSRPNETESEEATGNLSKEKLEANSTKKDKTKKKSKAKGSHYLRDGEHFSKNTSKYFKGSNLGHVQGYGR